MSIYFDFDVGPSGRRFRRAVDSDRHDIEVFWKRTQTEALFGEVNIGSLIELSTLSICMINEENAVTGFMALFDHPPLSCVDPADWEMWIRNTFERFYLSRNTLFVHFVCCVDEVHEFFVDEAFISIFKNDAYLNYIVLLVPSGCPEAGYLRFPVPQKCTVFRSKVNGDGEHGLRMLVAFRQDFVPKLKIRRAVEEDNDDIVKILDKMCPRMKELYGEYYISEIIGRHPESGRKIIVAEHEDHAVGVMCLNSNINYERLQKTYELKQFYGLKKATAMEREKLKRSNKLLTTFGYPIINGKWSPFRRMKKLETHIDNYVPTKYYYCCEQALYVAHRSSVLGKLRVREAEFSDVPQIAHLMQNVEGNETISTIENSILHEKEHSVFVFLCGTKIIGVGILELPEQIDFIRAKFNIDSYHIHKYHTSGLTCGFTVLKTMLVYPVFEPHYRFFARDMMRLSNNNIMLWMTANRNKLETQKANSMISAMIPLVPRRSEISCTNIPELKKINKLSKTVLPFSTWCMSKKFSSLPTMTVNSRIVVVGASKAAMAFLETLLFSDASTYLTFTNVTLISSNGLPYIQHPKPYAEYMFPKYRTVSDKYLKSIPYTYYVNVVHGTVVEIDKANKYVKLASESVIHYDLLFLMFGKQYQHPDYFNDVLEKQKQISEGKATYQPLDVPRAPDVIRMTTEYLPDNVFIVNDIVDANKSIMYVKNLIWHNDHYKIIVFGSYIDTYCCLAALLEINVNPKNIYFVEPFPPEDSKKTRVADFCNVYVDQTMKQVLDTLKVNVYRSYYFKSWTVGPDNSVSQVQFLSHLKLLQLDCNVFFYYGKRGINTQAFVAIHKSGIGYDGGILIDHQFRTKDPNVYAAGPGTRYFRRYYAENKRHKYYDSHEVGVKLGTLIRNKLDPLFNPKEKIRIESTKASDAKTQFGSIISDSSNTTTSRNESNGSDNIHLAPLKESLEEAVETVPDLRKPIVTHCMLPGGFQYLKVGAPGKKEPHHYVQSLSFNGYVLETYKIGYFKIHLTKDFIVDGITCLTPEKLSLENFTNLYGLSAIVLNNLQIRFEAKKLDCFYEFFRQPWAYFLYIDKFDELFGIVKELLPKGENQGKTLGEALCSISERLSDPSKSKSNVASFSEHNRDFAKDESNTKTKIRANFERSSHIEAIIDYVLDWLSENDILLPMFLRPDQTALYLHDLDNHPAFRKKK